MPNNESDNDILHDDNDNDNDNDVPLLALNHVSRVCTSVKESLDFYTNVLGFVLIERPEAFHFDGAWLFNYGVGIHLVHNSNSDDQEKLMPPPRDKEHDDLDPMDNHISFQCENMEDMEKRLKEFNVKYMKRRVGDEAEAEGEGGAAIDQLFFKDPDGFMIEICNCENLKLVPQNSIACPKNKLKLPCHRHNPPIHLDNSSSS